jgi:hypothetical protein
MEKEFRKHADRCRVEAEKSNNPADSAFWLLLAENWQKLAQDYEETRREEAELRAG